MASQSLRQAQADNARCHIEPVEIGGLNFFD